MLVPKHVCIGAQAVPLVQGRAPLGPNQAQDWVNDAFGLQAATWPKAAAGQSKILPASGYRAGTCHRPRSALAFLRLLLTDLSRTPND